MLKLRLCIITYLQGRNFAKIIGGAHSAQLIELENRSFYHDFT